MNQSAGEYGKLRWLSRTGTRHAQHSELLCNTGSIYLCSGIQNAPDEENGTGLDVANQEDERTVDGDLD